MSKAFFFILTRLATPEEKYLLKVNNEGIRTTSMVEGLMYLLILKRKLTIGLVNQNLSQCKTLHGASVLHSTGTLSKPLPLAISRFQVNKMSLLPLKVGIFWDFIYKIMKIMIIDKNIIIKCL